MLKWREFVSFSHTDLKHEITNFLIKHISHSRLFLQQRYLSFPHPSCFPNWIQNWMKNDKVHRKHYISSLWFLHPYISVSGLTLHSNENERCACSERPSLQRWWMAIDSKLAVCRNCVAAWSAVSFFRDRPSSTDLVALRPNRCRRPPDTYIIIFWRREYHEGRCRVPSASCTDWWQGKYAAAVEARWQALLKSHSYSSRPQFIKRSNIYIYIYIYIVKLFKNLWELFMQRADRSVSSED